MVLEKHVIEELFNLLQHYPVWPGDTLSHGSMAECECRGWAVRQEDGSWIPTRRGIAALSKALLKEVRDE